MQSTNRPVLQTGREQKDKVMVTYRVEHEHVIFSVSEDLTLDNIASFVEVFEQAIEECRVYRVIIEVHNISMADSSGIGALVSQYKRLKDKGGSIVLVGAKEGLLETLRVTALDRILMPQTNLEKALEQNPPGQAKPGDD